MKHADKSPVIGLRLPLIKGLVEALASRQIEHSRRDLISAGHQQTVA